MFVFGNVVDPSCVHPCEVLKDKSRPAVNDCAQGIRIALNESIC